MANVIIFGLAENSSLAHFFLNHDSEHDVKAFTVHEEFLPEGGEFEGLPVIAFEDIESRYSSDDYKLFAPLSPAGMNKNREKVFRSIKDKGYRMISYVSSRATTFPGAEIGENCFILEDNTIQPFTTIGDNVMLWSGNHIGHHGAIADHVSFTSHVVLSGRCDVRSYCFFGVNATIRDGLTLAEGSLIAMAASVTRDTEEWKVYVGNPAKALKKDSRTML